MEVIALQLDIAWEDKAANFATVEARLSAMDVQSGSLIVLPEMFATGFTMNVAAMAEIPQGDTFHFMSHLAKTYQAHVVGGVITEAPDGRGRNEALVINPDGSENLRYCKRHPFSFANETDHYAPGDAIEMFTWNGFIVAPFVCYDLRFPEDFRAAVSRGAEIFTVIANWPAARTAHWTALLRARAIENQAYVIGVNRCGTDPNHPYDGHSTIFDAKGEPLTPTTTTEQTLTATLDRQAQTEYRQAFPALQDMRED
jgi:predicted amidohydrolase